jgi:hypothetical protein
MAKAIKYTKKLGRKVAKSAMVSGRPKRYHIISSLNNGGWSVVNEGAVKSLRGFKTKREAISYAKKSPNKSISEVIVHSKDGRIQDIISR